MLISDPDHPPSSHPSQVPSLIIDQQHHSSSNPSSNWPKKKPFIQTSESKHDHTPNNSIVNHPATKRITSQSRTLNRSIPQMIISNSDQDLTQDHSNHPPTIIVPQPSNSNPNDPHQQLCCAGCRQLIAGRIVHAIDQRWHPDCFTCQHCGLALEHVAFYEHEGKAYCGVDYDELFSLKCYHCNTSINEDSYVTLDDPSLKDGPRHYHQLHLFCSECGDPFINPKSLEQRSKISKHHHPSMTRASVEEEQDEEDHHLGGSLDSKNKEPKPFVLYKGFPYCEGCDIKLHRPKCFECKRPILGDFINTLNKLYHSECFVCFKCDSPFYNHQFFLLPIDRLDPNSTPRRGSKSQVPICVNCYS